jgi:hypothetical protein
MSQIATIEFISASTAAIVHAELGFVPDAVLFIQNHGGTNPNLYLWFNNDKHAQWAAALSLLVTGSTGVVTRDTSGISKYAGGDTIASTETANTDGKHIDRDGTFASAGHITAPGVSIPADHQTNSGRNMILAFKGDR